jgi:hypothetical protein
LTVSISYGDAGDVRYQISDIRCPTTGYVGGRRGTDEGLPCREKKTGS